MSDGWSQEQRILLEKLLSEIIPASADGRIPSAGSPVVMSYLEGRVKADPELAALFSHGLGLVAELTRGRPPAGLDREAGVELLGTLEKREPAFFQALLRHTYMGYYTDTAVPPLFGLSARPPQPDGYEVPDEDLETLAALVEPVKSRGPCYREV